MMLRAVLTLALGLLVGLAASSLQPAAPAVAQPPAQVRVAHVAPGIGLVDIFVNGAPAQANVAFGTVSAYAPVAPGTVPLAAVPVGAPPTATVFNVALAFEAGLLYTVLVLPELPGNAPIVLVDNPLAPPGAAELRFVNASPNAPPLDLTVAGAPPLFSGVPFGETTAPIPLPPGLPALQVRESGADVPLDTDPVALPASGSVAVVAIGVLGGAPPLGLLPISGS